jgi:hypothetical protein
MEPNVLYRNDGPKDPKQGPRSDWKFSDVSVLAGVTEPIRSFPTWFWDFDNDGWLDIFVAGYFINNVGDVAADYLGLPHTAERARLYRNNRDGTFTDVTRAVGLFKVLHAMGSNFGDLDNDGWLDFYLGTGDPDLGTLIPNRMFRNAEGKLFQDVTTSGGFGHLQKGHGVSFADFDNDGDQDVHEDMGGAFAGDLARNVLYENPGNQNHWIKLKLEGTKSNRAAIGARIKLTARRSTESREIHLWRESASAGDWFGRSHLAPSDRSFLASLRQDTDLQGCADGPLLPDCRGKGGTGRVEDENLQIRRSHRCHAPPSPRVRGFKYETVTVCAAPVATASYRRRVDKI